MGSHGLWVFLRTESAQVSGRLGAAGPGVGGEVTPWAVGVNLHCLGQVNGRMGVVPRHTSHPAPGPQQHQALGVLWA